MNCLCESLNISYKYLFEEKLHYGISNLTIKMKTIPDVQSALRGKIDKVKTRIAVETASLETMKRILGNSTSKVPRLYEGREQEYDRLCLNNERIGLVSGLYPYADDEIYDLYTSRTLECLASAGDPLAKKLFDWSMKNAGTIDKSIAQKLVLRTMGEEEYIGYLDGTRPFSYTVGFLTQLTAFLKP